MRKYQDILGLPVISIKEGKVLGKVVNEFVDVEEASVIGFTVEAKQNKKYVLLLENIVTLGRDAIIVSASSQLRTKVQIRKEKKTLKLGRKLIGLKILTKKGKQTNKEVASFHFKSDTGKITHYEISGGVLHDVLDGRGLLSQDGVISIGSDAITVEESALNLSKIFKKGPGLTETLEPLKYKTKDKIKKVAKKVKTTTKKASDDTRNKGKNDNKSKKRK